MWMTITWHRWWGSEERSHTWKDRRTKSTTRNGTTGGMPPVSATTVQVLGLKGVPDETHTEKSRSKGLAWIVWLSKFRDSRAKVPMPPSFQKKRMKFPTSTWMHISSWLLTGCRNFGSWLPVDSIRSRLVLLSLVLRKKEVVKRTVPGRVLGTGDAAVNGNNPRPSPCGITLYLDGWMPTPVPLYILITFFPHWVNELLL